MGTEVADTEAAEIKDTAAPEPTAETIEREAEETIEEGSVAVEDEESSASAEDEISEDDEEEKEEEEDPERLSELEILPGKTAYINFYYTIDPEIEGMKDQKVDFSFAYTLEDEEGKQTKNTLRETFRYAVDALNLMTVTAGGEKGYVETGKEDEMLLEFDLGLMREVLEEAIEEELEKTENGDASAAEAKRASASELLVGWEDENGERPLGKKDPAVIKNLKCEVETFGVKLDKFKAIPVKDDDNFGTSLKCSFYVSRKTLPGTYYGRVNASYKIKGKSFHTTQGFKVVVKQETGEMELVGKIGDSEIIMTGPVSSFPKADELSLKVSEITQEQQEKVDEALQKKAEEEGTEISQYKALDIKLMADGVETEPEGDVQVRFKNVNLEKVDENKEAEQEKAEEKSIVKKAVRKVMSLFGARDEEEDVAAVAETGTEGEAESKDSEDGKAEGSEEGAGESGEAAENSENIKVLHLDEDAVVANEMKSEVQDNGDVVMDTDHFSVYLIYVTVNIPNEKPIAKIIVKHYADFDKWEIQDENDNLVEAKKEYFYTGDVVNKEGIKVGTIDKTKVSENEKENLDYVKVSGIWKKAHKITNTDGTISFKLVEEKENYYYTGFKIQNGGKVLASKPSDGSIDLAETKLSLVEVPAEVKTGVDDNNTKYKTSKLYPGSTTQSAETPYETVKTELYSEDVIELPNGSGTGIDREVLIENFAKAGNYEVQYVKVINSKYTDSDTLNSEQSLTGGKFKPNSSKQTIELTDEENIIEIYYAPKLGTKEYSAEFHDYNVTIAASKDSPEGKEYLKSDDATTENIHVGFRTRRVGMNNVNLVDGIQKKPGDEGYIGGKENALTDNHNRIGVGIWAGTEGDSAIWHHYLNQHGGVNPFKDYTIPNTTLSTEKYEQSGKKKIVFSNNNVKTDPGLFIPKDISITEEYYNKDKGQYDSTNEYFAKKYFSDFSLTFDRKGDKYVLTTVKQKNNNELEDLDKLQFTGFSSSKKKPMYSNLFWPLDNVSYGIEGVTRDPLFGSQTSDDIGKRDKYGFNHNDEIPHKTSTEINDHKTNYGHNWYFGMRYDFSFNIGDYTGPMNYYFRGDDDFWLYIDGQLVEEVDIGGVHIANGAFVDIKKWLEGHGGIDRDKDYEVSIFFMERGGTGSCCYMAFTLPNVTNYENDSTEASTTYKVEKKWQDGIISNGVDTIASKPTGSVRPTKIMVQLYQDGLKFGKKVELNENNNWTYEWNLLPKYSEVGTNVLHQYSVGEVSYGDEGKPYDENYVKDPHYDETKAEGNKPGSTIITNIRQIDIPVQKKWIGDNKENRPDKIEVNLWKKLIDIPGSGADEAAVLQRLMEEATESSDDFAEDGATEDANNSDENSSDEYEDVESEDVPNKDSSEDPKQETTTDNGNNTFVVLDKTDLGWENDWSKATRGQGNNKEEVPQIILSDENNWTDNTTWVNMPLYELDETTKTWKKVVYAIEEVNDGQLTPNQKGGWYEATYECDITKGFTVTNNFIIPVNIPISKQCIAFNGTKEFKFKIEEVNSENDWTLKLNPSFSETTSINVSDGTGKGKFVITYKMKEVIDEILDSPNKKIERWYKISEDEKDGTNFINDKTFYIVKVELKQEADGSYVAQWDPTKVYKNGTLLENKEVDLKFINYKKVDLEISKKVDKGSTTKSFAFTAEITLPENGDVTSFKLPPSTPVKGEYVENPDGSFSTGYADGEIITNSDGSKFIKVSFELKDSSKVIIPVPIGASIKIQETEHAGYYVSYEGSKNLILINDGEDAVKFTVEDSGKISVNCTNTPGAVLPDTGGPGLLMMSRLGWMLLLLALLMAGMEIQFYGERRNRKMANVQREDTRGFDPDDY